MYKVINLFLSVAFVAACSPTVKMVSGDAGQDNTSRINDIWVLKELNGKAITADDYSRESPRLEINIKEQRAMGNTSCNDFTGAVVISNTALKFDKVASTRMYCDKSVEPAFLKMLTDTDNYRFEKENYLVLLSGTTVLGKFIKVD